MRFIFGSTEQTFVLGYVPQMREREPVSNFGAAYHSSRVQPQPAVKNG